MAGTKIFIDTGALFARFYQRDQYHQKAVQLWNELEDSSTELITTGYVLGEFATLLARRTTYEYSAKILPLVYQSDIQIEPVTQEDEVQAISLFAKYTDLKIEFVDCLSFALMKRIA